MSTVNDCASRAPAGACARTRRGVLILQPEPALNVRQTLLCDREIGLGGGVLPDWPADHVERRAVATLIPYARNARTHSDAQVAQLAGSIREWGWTTPVLIDETSGIIAGHGRVLAAHLLGLPEVPVIVARGWSEAQKRAYVLADNKLAENAGWNDGLLAVELKDLAASDFDMSLIGFTADEMATLTADRSEGLTDPDEVPDPPAQPVTVLGDVWLLGAKVTCPHCGKTQAAKPA